MYVKRTNEILDNLKTTHTSLRYEVTFNTENKRRALYMLQGSVIAAVQTAVKLGSDGYLLPMIMQWNMIREATDLIWLFDEKDDNSKDIHNWFEGRTEDKNKRDLKVSIEQRAKKHFLAPAQVEQYDEIVKIIDQELCKYTYPTFQLAQMNMSNMTKIFDYDRSFAHSLQLHPREITNLFLLEAIESLLVPRKNLPLTEDESKRLLGYIDEIQKALH